MANREPDKEHQWTFNLLPYQLRIINFIHDRMSVEAEEIVKLFGSWHDLMLRGLVKTSGTVLLLTSAGRLVHEASQIALS